MCTMSLSLFHSLSSSPTIKTDTLHSNSLLNQSITSSSSKYMREEGRSGTLNKIVSETTTGSRRVSRVISWKENENESMSEIYFNYKRSFYFVFFFFCLIKIIYFIIHKRQRRSNMWNYYD